MFHIVGTEDEEGGEKGGNIRRFDFIWDACDPDFYCSFIAVLLVAGWMFLGIYF